MVCIYGSQALLTASKDILKDYNIDGRFKVIQFSIMGLNIPGAIVSIINIKGKDDVYTEEVMTTAYEATIVSVIMMLLSFGYRHYFNEQTAKDAYRNMKNESFIDPDSQKVLSNGITDDDVEENNDDGRTNATIELETQS